MSPPRRLFGYLWLVGLGLLLFTSALLADRISREVEEYPFGCDSFGYLQTAQAIRQGAAHRVLPELAIQQPRTELLVNFMKAQGLAVENWEEIVAPHAYRYYPRSGRVGPVFPPGAGLVLAIFPEGAALLQLNRANIGFVLVLGLAVLVFAAVKHTWFSAGVVILVLHLVLAILWRIGSSSFSINALLAPLLFSAFCLFVGCQLRDNRAWLFRLFACIAGVFFGFAVLVRPPVGFVLPGLVVLLWPSSFRSFLKSPLVALGLGILVGGALPLGLFQSRLVGAWYLPTYGRSDMAPPTLDVLSSNFWFYLGNGEGSTDNLILLTFAVCSIGLILWPGQLKGAGQEATKGFTWRRLLVAAAVMWGLPMAYFLTHKVAVHFYAVPATLATGLLLSSGLLLLELKRKPNDLRGSDLMRSVALVIVAVLPGLVIMQQLWTAYLPETSPAQTRHLEIPSELSDQNSWIWGGMLTGTLWYYNRIPAYKVQFTVPEVRRLMYEFAAARGDKQYFIRDSADMQSLEEEIIALGGTLESRGSIDGYPYFRIHWPVDGPRKTPVALMPQDKPTGANE